MTDTSGNPVAGAQLTVTKTNVISPLPIIYTIQSDGSIFASANPFNSDSNGEYVFAVESGSYSIEATGSSAVLNISKTITQFTPSTAQSEAMAAIQYNRILNPFFYASLSPWVATGSTLPTYSGIKSRTTGTGCCEITVTTPTPSSTATVTGSVSQPFNIPPPTAPVQLGFYTAIRTSNVVDNYSGSVTVYIYNGGTGLESLVGTFTHSIVANKQVNNVWELATKDITSYVASGGSFILRLEMSATATDTGGVVSVFSVVSIDDVYIVA